jgi:FkbM family methyltransferase
MQESAMPDSAVKPIIHTNVPGQPALELVAYYDEFLQYYPNCEMRTKQWLVENVRPDWVSFDCGANIGYFSILLSRLAPQGHVHAFEPTETHEMLLRNLAHHKVDNVTAIRQALGNKSGAHEDNIYRVWGNEPERKVYPFITIDEYVREQALSRVDCIKIDVDSYDFEVLRGAEQTLRAFNPFVVVELNHALSRRGQSNVEALQWLAEQGYTNCAVLDYDNFILKRGWLAEASVGGRPMELVIVPPAGSAAEAPPAMTPAADSGTVSSVAIADLPTKLGFSEAFEYPAESLARPLTEWDMERDDGPTLRYLYRNFRPRRHLEFGTWYGAGVLRVLEECDATVFTLNLPEGESKPSGEWAYGTTTPDVEAVPSWVESRTTTTPDGGTHTWYRTDSRGFIGSKYLERGLGHRVCQILCDSRQWDSSNYPAGFFDSAFIDGGHQYEVIESDTAKALHLVRPGGLILWHDYCPDPAVQSQSGSTRDVRAFIAKNRAHLMEQLSDLFWIQPSWLLVGIKK